MTALASAVERNILSRGLLRPGEKVLVGVSGGLDSMVLLHLLHGLSRKNGWVLVVAHFNHRLRGRASGEDQKLVRRVVARLGLASVCETADVSGFATKNKLSVEMAARGLRHEFLARSALRRRARVIALAHHADDQAELFLIRLFRGSGGEGLSGMKWRSQSPARPRVRLVRPLLDQTKSVLEEYARAEKVPYREDATNTSSDFLRNRIRCDLLPLLKSEYQPAIERVILRVMDVAGAESDFVGTAAKEWLKGGMRSQFSGLHVALQRRAIQMQLLDLGVVSNYDLVETLRLFPGRPVSVGSEQAAVLTPRGVVRLESLERPAFRGGSLEVRLGLEPGGVAFDGVRIEWEVKEEPGAARPRPAAGLEYFDADKVGESIRLRHWRPGDRFQPIGMGVSAKLQDLFVNGKVLRKHRHRMTLGLNDQGEVFWVEGLRISERFKLTEATQRRLKWCWERL